MGKRPGNEQERKEKRARIEQEVDGKTARERAGKEKRVGNGQEAEGKTGRKTGKDRAGGGWENGQGTSSKGGG